MSGRLTESITPLCDDLFNPSPSSKPIDGEKGYAWHYFRCLSPSNYALNMSDFVKSLVGRYGKLRPFQRKWALLATAVDLLNTLDFLNDYQKQEIMFRTNSSKEPLAPELAW